MKLNLPQNSYFDLQLWRPGFDPISIAPGSILFSKNDELMPCSFNHKIIYFGQLFHKRRMPDKNFSDANIMHVSLVINPTGKDDNSATIIESNLNGLQKLNINLDEYARTNGIAFFVFTPKSDKLRALLISMANLSLSKEEKMQYPYLQTGKSIFNHTVQTQEKIYDQVASVIADLMQDRQILDQNNKLQNEFCSSFVMLLIQASFMLEKLSEEVIKEIVNATRTDAIKIIKNNLPQDAIPKGLNSLHDFMLPGEMYSRILYDADKLPPSNNKP